MYGPCVSVRTVSRQSSRLSRGVDWTHLVGETPCVEVDGRGHRRNREGHERARCGQNGGRVPRCLSLPCCPRGRCVARICRRKATSVVIARSSDGSGVGIRDRFRFRRDGRLHVRRSIGWLSGGGRFRERCPLIQGASGLAAGWACRHCDGPKQRHRANGAVPRPDRLADLPARSSAERLQPPREHGEPFERRGLDPTLGRPVRLWSVHLAVEPHCVAQHGLRRFERLQVQRLRFCLVPARLGR